MLQQKTYSVESHGERTMPKVSLRTRGPARTLSKRCKRDEEEKTKLIEWPHRVPLCAAAVPLEEVKRCSSDERAHMRKEKVYLAAGYATSY